MRSIQLWGTNFQLHPKAINLVFMRKFIYVALSAFLLSIGSYAQETVISGSVKNEQTGEAVVGVNIMLKDLYVGTITDLQGNFSFKTKRPSPYNLVFSCVGFESKEFTLNNPDEHVDITLKEGTIMGEEVIGIAGRGEEKGMLSAGSREKMGSKERSDHTPLIQTHAIQNHKEHRTGSKEWNQALANQVHRPLCADMLNMQIPIIMLGDQNIPNHDHVFRKRACPA